MKAAILLYTYAGNSFRGAERAMEVFNFVFPFLTIAEHKVLMTLAVPAQQGGHPLACSDAEVVDIHVAGSHKGKDIKEAIERTTERLGKAPVYAVTDNGRNLARGLSDAGIDNHRDISHTFGTFLKSEERKMYAFLWERYPSRIYGQGPSIDPSRGHDAAVLRRGSFAAQGRGRCAPHILRPYRVHVRLLQTAEISQQDVWRHLLHPRDAAA